MNEFTTLFQKKNVSEITQHPYYQHLTKGEYNRYTQMFEYKHQFLQENMNTNIQGLTQQINQKEDEFFKQTYFASKAEIGARLYEALILQQLNSEDPYMGTTHMPTQSEIKAFKPFLNNMMQQIKKIHKEQFTQNKKQKLK